MPGTPLVLVKGFDGLLRERVVGRPEWKQHRRRVGIMSNFLGYALGQFGSFGGSMSFPCGIWEVS